MSEPTPLWSDDDIEDLANSTVLKRGRSNRERFANIVDTLRLMRRKYEAERAKDKQRIQELEAELARLREQQWEPLPDGNYNGLDVSANGSEIGLSTHDVHGIQWPVDHWLSDDIRLCRKVAAPMHPFEEGYSHHQFNVPVSRDTLGALEAVLAGETSAVRDVVRVWLDRAWHTINGEWPERNADAQPKESNNHE